jgi:hypothetical protein
MRFEQAITCLGIFYPESRFGLYGKGAVDFGKSYIYLTACTNFSQVGRTNGWVRDVMHTLAVEIWDQGQW